MAQVTNTDVFDFMGTPADQRVTQGPSITSLISREIKYMEDLISRRIENEVFTNVLFDNGTNAKIYGRTLVFSGKYRDTYAVTAVNDDGKALTEITDNDQVGDYVFDKTRGALIKKDEDWSTEPLAVKISGSLGLVDESAPFDTKADLKQILIERVAAKSGLWKINVQTEDGDIETIRTDINPATDESLKRYKLRDI